jgi:hypothetical protein
MAAVFTNQNVQDWGAGQSDVEGGVGRGPPFQPSTLPSFDCSTLPPWPLEFSLGAAGREAICSRGFWPWLSCRDPNRYGDTGERREETVVSLHIGDPM